MTSRSPHFIASLAVLALVSLCPVLRAQAPAQAAAPLTLDLPAAPEPSSSSLVADDSSLVLTGQTAPNTPTAQSSTHPASASPSDATQSDTHTDKQTSRILGIIPNFRAVSANEQLPPQSVKDKFITASEDSFDYSSIVLPAFVAGVNLARKNTPEFGTGGVGYGRYLWHTVVDQTDENYMVEFVVPSITHEDTRYYTLGCCGFTKRAGYALSRAVITRTDSGKKTFNFSEVIGGGAAAGISNLYYPRPERTVSNTMDQWGLNVGIDALTFVVKEFWPDINHYLFHGNKPFQDATPAPK